ncbi:MAG: carboxymuconolactone decarboxylase family protein [Pseudarcicella sp.]|jgi:alkyl hydroperoxide reductase subunit D|nr:carboxymuconolactone decarboxylase family protein [Pseudarcicella sp.]MBP6409581.1 carboxymuconolactone decarboxylase family protein [Pseudarcicella sp.]
MTLSNNETKLNLYEAVNISSETESALIEKLSNADHRYLKDLKINITNVLKEGNLSAKEIFLTAYAVAINEKNELLKVAFEQLSIKNGATEPELVETLSCVSLMNANNIYYRFRHFVNKDSYTNAPAGIRMSIMANPILGKEFFELMSLVVSSINGCEMCVTSHEASVKAHGGTEARIMDAVRLGAILKSFIVLL